MFGLFDVSLHLKLHLAILKCFIYCFLYRMYCFLYKIYDYFEGSQSTFVFFSIKVLYCILSKSGSKLVYLRKTMHGPGHVTNDVPTFFYLLSKWMETFPPNLTVGFSASQSALFKLVTLFCCCIFLISTSGFIHLLHQTWFIENEF